MTTHTLTIPTPCEWLNSNDRLHYHAEAALTKRWRAAASWAAIQARTPHIDGPVTIEARVFKATNHKFDPPNLYPTIKAAIDGLVRHPKHGGADVLADDDYDHVTALTISRGHPDDQGSRLILIIRPAKEQS